MAKKTAKKKVARARKGKARKSAAPRKSKKTSARKAAPRKKVARKAVVRKAVARKAVARKAGAARKARGASRKAAAPKRRRGGTGRERELAQTPETGRSVRGLTNPMPTRRSTGTPAGAGDGRKAPGLDRARRRLREVEETVQGPPSSLDLDRSASAARTGRREMREARLEHNETSPVLTGGDVDANWEDAYSVGDEAPGGDNPTPDQDRVDDIGKALGVEYQDNEELRASDKIADRDRHRWELDPASSEDYRDRD
jgi:hypothetical protein